MRLSAASNNDPRSVFVASIAYGTKKKRKKKRASVELCQNNARESYSKPRTMNRAVLGGRARKFKVTRLRGSCTLDPTERERKREKKKKKKEFFRYTRNKFIANPVERNAEWGRLFSSNICFVTLKKKKKIAEKNLKKSDRSEYPGRANLPRANAFIGTFTNL